MMHPVMSYTDWLRKQVARLEQEIGGHSVFESSQPATMIDLEELRSRVVLHTYLRQELLRRDTIVSAPPLSLPEDADTQEFVIVRRA